MKIIKDHDDYVVVEDTIKHAIMIDAPPLIAPIGKGLSKEDAAKWAKKFCEANADLLKRLADR